MLKKLFMLILPVLLIMQIHDYYANGSETEEIDYTKQLMEVSGFNRSILLLPQMIRYQLLGRDEDKTLPVSKEEILKIIDESVDASLIQKDFYEKMHNAFSPEEMDTLIGWFESDPGKRIIEQELKALEKDEMKERDDFSLDIRNLQVSPERSALLQKYDDTINLTKHSSEFANSAKKELAKNEISESEKRKISNDVFIRMLFTYRNISDDDLSAYIDFLASDSGSKFTRLSREIEQPLTMAMMKKVQEGIVKSVTANSGVYKFEDLNFKFDAPGKPWIKLDVKKINPEASLYLQKVNADIHITIIAEKPDSHMLLSNETLLDISKANFEKRFLKIKFYGEKKFKVNGLQGIRYSYDATVDNQGIHSTIWVYSAGGYLYQVLFFGPEKAKKAIDNDFKKLVKGFHVIEEGRQAYSESINYLNKFSSPEFNYGIDLKGKGWVRWDDVDDEVPEAEVGGHKDLSYFFIIPAYYGGNKPKSDAVLSAFLKFLNVTLPDKNITNLAQIDGKDMEGYTFNLKRKNDEGMLSFKFKIIITPEFAYMACIWAPEQVKNLDSLSDELFNSMFFHIKDDNTFESDTLENPRRESQADFYNYVGLYYFGINQYDSAFTYFRLAFDLKHDNETYLKNAVHSLSTLNRYSEAFSLLAPWVDKFSDSRDIKAWHAWLLYKTDQKEESLKHYTALFNNGHRDDDDFIIYLQILAEYKRWEEAEEAFKEYLKTDASLPVYVAQARLKREEGRYEEAIMLMEERQKDIPFNASIAFEIIQNYMQMKSYKKVMEIADELIKNEMYPYDAYYYRGEAEYQLKWYREAKKSVEKALEYMPNDKDAKDFILHISGLLGEGNNTNVKKMIDPVELPPELDMGAESSLLPESVEYGAFYLNRIKGIAYEKDSGLKITTYEKIKVVDSSGVLNLSTIDIDFNPLYEDVYVNKIDIVNEQGEIVSSVPSSDYYVIDNQDTYEATHEKTLNIPVLQLKPGYIIDLVYTIQKYSDSFPYFAASFSKERPVVYSAIFYRGDMDSIRYMTSGPISEVKTADGMVWYLKNPYVYKWEPLQVHYEEYMPFIWIGSAGQEWAKIGNDYLEQIKDKLELTPAVKEYAEELTKGLEGEDDKIKAIINDVQINYTYKAIEFGRRASIPNSCDITIKNRYGDCKDHALLLHMLLKAISVKSYLVLVDSYGGRIKDSIPDMDQFNHMIVYLPEYRGGVFIDPTEKRTDALAQVPAELGGKQALVLDPENISLKNIPLYKEGSNGLKIDRTVTVEDNDMILINETIRFTGKYAGFMRENLIYRDKALYKQWVQSLFTEYLKSSNVDTFEVRNLLANTEDLIFDIKYRFALKNNIKEDGFILKVPNVWEEYYLQGEPVDDRKTDFEIRYPFYINSSLAIELPEHYTATAAKDSTFSSDFGSSKTGYNRDSMKSFFNFSGERNKGRYKKDQYNEYINYSNKLIAQSGPEIEITVIQ